MEVKVANPWPRSKDRNRRDLYYYLKKRKRDKQKINRIYIFKYVVIPALQKRKEEKEKK